MARWDPASFHGIDWHWPKDVMKPLGSVLRRRVDKVDRSKYAFTDLQPITIHFDGSMDKREVDQGREYSMDLFFARPGDIVVAKIDLKNGAVGIVPRDWEHVVTTGHFRIYKPDLARLEPQYLHLLIQTALFKAMLWRNKVGAEGRKEVKMHFFESVPIPLPPVSVQRAIVARWRRGQEAVVKAKEQLKQVGAKLDKILWGEYQKRAGFDVIRRRYLGVNWRDSEAWDMKSARAAAYRLAFPDFVPMSSFAEEATELVHPSGEPEKEWPVYGVNNKEGVFLNCHQKGSEFNAPYKRIQHNWFFHNPTRANVGSLGVVQEVPEDAITSPEYQVWRIKDDTPPGYVATLITTSFFLELIQFHRVGAVKQRLYVENLLRIPIPRIPRNKQERIAEKRSAALIAINKARGQSKEIKSEVEEMILGSRAVDG